MMMMVMMMMVVVVVVVVVVKRGVICTTIMVTFRAQANLLWHKNIRSHSGTLMKSSCPKLWDSIIEGSQKQGEFRDQIFSYMKTAMLMTTITTTTTTTQRRS